ncbi:hypothetical protein EK0264_12495 [Epidermidibacterium keratini]|uniref:Uncharacterized protein n=1 Tax=Epidermidibacterium keratini TaxID=1891644 RepID=A0A7L4YPE4_9ACTN|nr:hypothetical protein [Epidermidibacterium keratini]QHC01026.1 hypothetical protein EK0264_12495 [Epidermidibacterium keratini]
MTSDLANIKAWWKKLGDDGFVVLPPPTRDRYTQGEGHEDATELLAERGLPTDTSYAFWQWQSQEAALGSGKDLIAPLLLHWGGDHAVVKAGLGSGPEGYEITDGGPQSAFALDRVTVRGADGLPDPSDEAGVRQFLDELDEPLDRRTLPFRYRPLTDAEDDWLHARLAQTSDLERRGEFFNALALRNADRAEDADGLQAAWREQYAGDLTEYAEWSQLLVSLLRHEHRDVWEIVREIGPAAGMALAAAPSERSVAELARLTLDGPAGPAGDWLSAYAELHEVDLMTAAAAVGSELAEGGAESETWSRLHHRLSWSLVDAWEAEALDRQQAAAIANVRIAANDNLPRELRSVAAREVAGALPSLRDQAAEGDSAQQIAPDYTAAQLGADLERIDDADLLAGTGPVLTQYEGGLNDTWNDYRELSDADITWLHAQVADPQTEMQGLGYCLELLYSHGVATVEDVEALRRRWKSDLAKKYETTYVEWRHPLVTLTCLALDLGDPLGAELEKWWAKPTPKWKVNLRLLTFLGAPTDGKAAELWSFVESGEYDEGQLLTWVLARARLDDRRPVDVADELFASDVRAHDVEKTLIAVVDPRQPLWSNGIGNSVGWWHRIVEVADDPALSATAREAALRIAGQHWMIAHPDSARGVLPTDIDAASQWYADRTT